MGDTADRDVYKNSVVVRLSEEMVAHLEGFKQRGRYETVPLTDEDIAAHARAVNAISELESNRWASRGYDGWDIEPLEPQMAFIPEETTEEWLARWRASKK